jgi:hypothetical protein
MEMTVRTFEPRTDLKVTVELGDPAGLLADGRVAYRVEINGVVFEGDDYRPSPLHASDGPEAVAALLGFLAAYGEEIHYAAQDGEESEHAANYSPEQLRTLADWHDELSMLAEEVQHPSIESLAQEASNAIGVRTRDDGTNYYAVDDDAPGWVQDVVYEAHGSMLPDDWRYAAIRSALSWIAEGNSEDDDHEWSDSEVDTYTSDRFQWLASHLGRQAYVDEATEELGASEGVAEAIGAGQYVEAREIIALVRRALQEVSES